MNPTEMNMNNPEIMTEEDLDTPGIEEREDSEDEAPFDLREFIEGANIAEKLDEDLLNEIGNSAKTGYEADKASRADWERALEEWTNLAGQVREDKTWPWPNASNVKYPLLTTASMQFAARAYPALVPSDGKVVKAQVIGKDPDGSKLDQAQRVSTYMSWQVMRDMGRWEEGMDKLLVMLPIVGTLFKKTYYNPQTEKPCSDLINPKDLVVDYWASDLDSAERISHRIEMSPRKLKERQLEGIFLDVDLGTPNNPADKGAPPPLDETTPYVLIEQHTFLDLDDDGYAEPYIVTFDLATSKVLRIAARFGPNEVKYKPGTSTVVRIEPFQYFTKFGFVPSPDGAFYDIGFGTLLGPINESVNTLINQLIDSGTLNNLNVGFLGKGLRLRMGEHGFRPGEWKTVNATGDDLKKQIVPLPTKEPSPVLFQLMGSLITSGKELASVAEIFTGKMPGQNTPATTTMATIEQGMKVFTAVYKRIFRSLAEEFDKIYTLNHTYLDMNSYADVVDVSVNPDDFDRKSHKIFPGADPTAISATEKLMKAQGLLELLPTGMLDPVKVISRVLEAQEQPNWEDLLAQVVKETGAPPPPPPDPKLQEMEMKGQLEQRKMAMQGAQIQQKMELEGRSEQAKLAMKAQEHAMEMQHKQQMNHVEAAGANHKQRIFSAQAQQELNLSAIQGAQTIQQKDAEHKQRLNQAAAQPKTQPKKGSTTKK